MTGKITGQVYRLDKDNQGGTIVCRDNRQYNFSMEDYRGKVELKEGHLVEFTTDGIFAREVALSTGPKKGFLSFFIPVILSFMRINHRTA